MKYFETIFLLLITPSFLFANADYDKLNDSLYKLTNIYTKYNNSIKRVNNSSDLETLMIIYYNDYKLELSSIESILIKHPEIIETKCFNNYFNKSLSEFTKLLTNIGNSHENIYAKFSTERVLSIKNKIFELNYNTAYKLSKYFQSRRYTLPYYTSKADPPRCLVGNCIDGSGELLFEKSCTKYIGFFKKGYFHGKGTLNATSYKEHGYWIKGKKHGKFEIISNNGTNIIANYIDGLLSGEEIFTSPKSFTSFTNYLKGNKNGVSITYYSSGDILFEHYENDNPSHIIKYLA